MGGPLYKDLPAAKGTLPQEGSVPKRAATPPAPPPKGTPPLVTHHLDGAGPERRSRVMCPRESTKFLTILYSYTL